VTWTPARIRTFWIAVTVLGVAGAALSDSKDILEVGTFLAHVLTWAIVAAVLVGGILSFTARRAAAPPREDERSGGG